MLDKKLYCLMCYPLKIKKLLILILLSFHLLPVFKNGAIDAVLCSLDHILQMQNVFRSCHQKFDVLKTVCSNVSKAITILC